MFRHRHDHDSEEALVEQAAPAVPDRAGRRRAAAARARERPALLTAGGAALAGIAVVDVIFAVDSVPAILAITPDAFIVFAANAFALLGLRPLFFLVAELVDAALLPQDRARRAADRDRRQDGRRRAVRQDRAGVLAARHRADPRHRRGRVAGPAAARGPRRGRCVSLTVGRCAASPPLAVALGLLGAVAAPAAAQDCVSADPPAVSAPERPLRLGIFPLAAGSAGAAQAEPAPEDPAKALDALRRLRPPGRELIVRLNRMFWADGDAGLARFAGLVDGYAREGFRTELQVRYHPPDGHEGDIAGWLEYVRARRAHVRAAARGGRARRSPTRPTCPVSPNTSDGSYTGVRDALVQGVVAARAEADRLGRNDLSLGFTYAYRNTPAGRRRVLARARRKGDAGLPRPRVDHVGLQIYPGLFWPPATHRPGRRRRSRR